MDFTAVIAQVGGMLVWFIPAVFLIALVKSPWMGELLVRIFAHRQLDEHTCRRIHNMTLNASDGTTQIDHVFLSAYGIFVLETKNMAGWIFGSEKQAQWTQKLYKRRFKFENSLRQLQAPQSPSLSLGVNPERLHSVITFVDTVLQALQVGRRSPTLATHRVHVQNPKCRSDQTAGRQCPKYGSALLIRTVKIGQQFFERRAFPVLNDSDFIDTRGRKSRDIYAP